MNVGGKDQIAIVLRKGDPCVLAARILRAVRRHRRRFFGDVEPEERCHPEKDRCRLGKVPAAHEGTRSVRDVGTFFLNLQKTSRPTRPSPKDWHQSAIC
ncbi:hypothetical protein T4D_5212 [Trichinella pseudospiralis]|uniref:Uncharacterized protein n=1 Tax=Trichinella pseudospiralis TaxID=6337 RepID=A0A0V1G0Z4_TRIPS|nr:hypothetical protein T4D_5212 [Trichinella pseudospiralis]